MSAPSTALVKMNSANERSDRCKRLDRTAHRLCLQSGGAYLEGEARTPAQRPEAMQNRCRNRVRVASQERAIRTAQVVELRLCRRRVLALEHELVLQIFIRSTRRVELTRAGVSFYERTVRIPSEVDLSRDHQVGGR